MDSQRPEHEYLAELALLKAALSAAEVARDAYASEVEDLKAELEECKPKPDNAALKQQVFTALGAELLYRLERHQDVDPGYLAQFDLLGRDL